MSGRGIGTLLDADFCFDILGEGVVVIMDFFDCLVCCAKKQPNDKPALLSLSRSLAIGAIGLELECFTYNFTHKYSVLAVFPQIKPTFSDF
jgi:hypothetical protein